MEGPIILAGASVMTTLDLSWLTSLECILCKMLCTSRSRITPRSPQSSTCLLLYKDEHVLTTSVGITLAVLMSKFVATSALLHFWQLLRGGSAAGRLTGR